MMMCEELGYRDRQDSTRERSVQERQSDTNRERARETEQERRDYVQTYMIMHEKGESSTRDVRCWCTIWDRRWRVIWRILCPWLAALSRSAVSSSVLQCTALWRIICSVWYRAAALCSLYCSVLQCVAARHILCPCRYGVAALNAAALQCVAVWRILSPCRYGVAVLRVWEFVAVCWGELQCSALCFHVGMGRLHLSVGSAGQLQCVAVGMQCGRPGLALRRQTTHQK